MQQINLYQPILRKQERVFSLNTLLLGNMIVLGLLLVIYFAGAYQKSSLQEQVDALQAERIQRDKALAEMRSKYPPRKKDVTLLESIKQKQALLDYRQRLIAELRIQDTGADGKPGFSEQFVSLARQTVRNIWFEEISLRENKQLTLQGKATSAEEVPQLLQRLSGESSFAGTVFSSVNITRKNRSELVAFTLRTEAEEKSVLGMGGM